MIEWEGLDIKKGKDNKSWVKIVVNMINYHKFLKYLIVEAKMVTPADMTLSCTEEILETITFYKWGWWKDLNGSKVCVLHS